MRFVIAASLLFDVAAAKPAPPAVVFDAEVTAVGKPPGFLCGFVLARQQISVQVRHVTGGHVKFGDRGVVDVVLCTEHPLLRHMQNDLLAIDPAQLRPGSLVHVRAQDFGNGQWLTSPDQITVYKR
jgi:hypothetical protein